MALTKQSVNVNFTQGLDLKTDPFQVQPGKFLALENSIFDKAGRLTKRNGFGPVTALPNNDSLYLTTFNGNLTAIGNDLLAYSSGTNQWVNKGALKPVSLDTLSLVRSNTNQPQADAVIAANGLVCTAYTDVGPSGPEYKYVIADSVTGQNVIAPQTLDADPAVGTPRVFLLGNYFVIIYSAIVTANPILRYVAVSTANPSSATAATNISTQYESWPSVAFDAVVSNNSLYIAWNGSDLGGAVRATYLTSSLSQGPTKVFTGFSGQFFSVAADASTNTPNIYVTFFDPPSSKGYTAVITGTLVTVLAPTEIIPTGSIINLTTTTMPGSATIYYEVSNAYGYDGSVGTDYINQVTITQTGTVGATTTLVRGVGLASKAFSIDGTIYFMGIYVSNFQPTYFLFNSLGQAVAKLAYSNGPNSYYLTALPGVSVSGNIAKIAYLYRDLVQSINKTQGIANAAGVYAQTGVNLVSFTIGLSSVVTSEIAHNLHLSGGFLWAYDGYSATEQMFHLWPDLVEATTTGTGGTITAQQYYYVATYEWADNQGNLYRGAPSIPITVTTTGSTSANTVYVPTLRVTYKTANPVKIVIYRWSAAQQIYYQVTSIASPVLNDPTSDYITFVDTQPDSAIIGNNILYTTGGVIENIGPPSTSVTTLFNNRLFLVDAEDKNLLWYSKQVIENTPVEMSDLLTIYVSPTISAQGTTGPITALSAMDDKLIIFKRDAVYYLNGNGPDNTGSNSQFSEPTFINSTVGCTNTQSIVFMPQGIMFQSDKGIWLLGRDLSTQYIGAPVETLTTGATVLSALNIPETNQVRFTLDTGVTLMYDYYFGQWGTFTGVPAIASTLYENLHTYLKSTGQIYQETPGTYLDNSVPVKMSFTTSWMSLAGLQGFERFYEMLLLGQYISPFKLNVQIAYNYSSTLQQSTIVTPNAPGPAWGGDSSWGAGTPWGGPSNVFEARIFPRLQKCESFQIKIDEMFDPTYGITAAGGLTLSGLNLMVGIKRGNRLSQASRNFG